MRPETGPMQFGDDWPGIFIRGDNAMAEAMMIEGALAGDAIAIVCLRSFAQLLKRCDARTVGSDIQKAEDILAGMKKQSAPAEPPLDKTELNEQLPRLTKLINKLETDIKKAFPEGGVK